MLQVKTKLQEERESTAAVKSVVSPIRPAPPRKANRLTFPSPRGPDSRNIQARVPAIIGEATFRGTIAVDGIVSGQPAANGSGALSIRQRGRSSLGAGPELNGEIRFIEMLRVSRHIAGSVYSEKGT